MSEAFTLFVNPHANSCISKGQQQRHTLKCVAYKVVSAQYDMRSFSPWGPIEGVILGETLL